jgi:hypothetical protein
METTKLDRESIMLMWALSECGRALKAFRKAQDLASSKTKISPNVERREWLSVFDQLRLGLQMAANVSRLFWPPRETARGERLRALSGLPERHGLSDRTLRNHIEHLDERLDVWTAQSPRPFLSVEIIVHDDLPPNGPSRDALMAAAAVIYDANARTMRLFGDVFDIGVLEAELEDVHTKVSAGLAEWIATEWTA